ncbi:MAG: hypothetical protein V8R80_00485 [Eubacterium sp.]
MSCTDSGILDSKAGTSPCVGISQLWDRNRMCGKREYKQESLLLEDKGEADGVLF